MFKVDPQATVDQIRRDYLKLVERGEAKIALLREKRGGASDSVMLELDDHIERYEAIVKSMRHGLGVVQDYCQTWAKPASKGDNQSN